MKEFLANIGDMLLQVLKGIVWLLVAILEFTLNFIAGLLSNKDSALVVAFFVGGIIMYYIYKS